MSIFPTRILVATDGSEEAEMAATTAANLTQKTGSEMHVVHVFGIAPVGPPVYPEATEFEGVEQETEAEQLQRISERRGREVLDAEVEKVRSDGGTVVEAHLIEGRVPPEIVALAAKLGAGLVVVGSRGLGGLRRALMGSVSSSVVHHAHCPVMVVRGEPLAFPTRILLATDGSEDARLAADTALELSKGLDSELHAVYVEPMPKRHSEPIRFAVDLPPEVVRSVEEEAKTKLEKLVGKMREEGGEVRQGHARVGLPPAEIVALAEGLSVGLIVIGSRGLGGIRRAVMGSVSDSVVRHAHCPVLVVRHAEKRAT